MKSDKVQVTIYTDGACSGNPGPGAWAAILIFGEIEKAISGFVAETTNNRMELQAAVEGLKALKQPCKVDLYSDSAYLVSGFNKGWLANWQAKGWKNAAGNPVSNMDLWQELLSLTQQHEVTWHKVKGHADNHYNNRCDELARGLIKAHRDSMPVPDAVVGQETMPDTPVQPASSQALSSASPGVGGKGDDLGQVPVQHFTQLREEIIKDEPIFSGRIIDVHHYEIKTAAGKAAKREIVHHGGGVAIVALTEDQEILLVSQFRLAANMVVLELPAGCLEPGEDPLQAAQRELAEETGCHANSWCKLAEFFVSPGYTTEVIHLYLAEDLSFGQQNLDEDEFLNLSKMSMDQALQACRDLEIKDAKTLSGILAAQDCLRRRKGGTGA